MGMFDTVHVDKEAFKFALPDDRIQVILDRYDGALPLQFKDLDCALEDYFIKENEEGKFTLTRDNVEREWEEYDTAEVSNNIFKGYMKKVKSEIVPVNETVTLTAGEISNGKNTDDTDIWFDFKIVIIAGGLDSIQLIDYRETPSKSRMDRNEAFNKKMLERIAFGKTIKGKLYNCISRILLRLYGWLNKLSSKVLKISSNIGRINK